MVGVLCMVIAGVIAALAATHANDVRAKLFTMSIWYVGAGVMLVGIYLVFFALPEWRQKRRNHRRRRGNYQVKSPTVSGGRASGMVLIYVLVMVGLVAALVLQAQITARTALKREQDHAQRAELRRAAEDAARHALQSLADDDNLRVDSTNDAWAATDELTTPSGIRTTVRIVDQDRFFDLNNASLDVAGGMKPPAEVIGDILVSCGQFSPSALIDALNDWIDVNDDGVHESPLYRKRMPPYDAANHVLYSWSDLLAINGFNRDLFRPPERLSSLDTFKNDIHECVTVLPVPRQHPLTINVNTATRGALAGVFGLAEERVVSTIIVLRSLKPITSLDVLAPTADAVRFESVRPYLDVKSRFFTVDASAEAEGHVARVHILAQRNASGSVDVLQWM
ncbi:MAG: hypothetical protein V1929_08710 [bacterium]